MFGLKFTLSSVTSFSTEQSSRALKDIQAGRHVIFVESLKTINVSLF